MNDLMSESSHMYITTHHVQRVLPREVDPAVYNMSTEDPGDVAYNEIGGLGEQVRELREVWSGFR